MARARRRTAETASSASHANDVGARPRHAGCREEEGSTTEAPETQQKGAKKRKRVSRGVYSDRYGLAATVKVNGIQRERRFPRGTPIRTIQGWRDEMRGNLRTLPKGAKHTLAHDAKKYLDQVGGRIVSIKDRRRNLSKWMARFGLIRTLELEKHIRALNEQLYQWRKELSGATCNHRRDALTNLTRVLYGSKAASGLSDLVTFPKPPPKRRWLDRRNIAEVLRHLEPGKIRVRLHLLHWTGMRPSQMGRLQPGDFRLDTKIPHVVVDRSKRGRIAAIPLLDEGIAAAEAYIKADAFGKWRPEAANKALSKAAEAAGLPRFTTYQIRHSFARGLRESGTDVADIQDLYGHTNAETTKIYAPAVLKKQRAAIERLRKADGAGSDQTASA